MFYFRYLFIIGLGISPWAEGLYNFDPICLLLLTVHPYTPKKGVYLFQGKHFKPSKLVCSVCVWARAQGQHVLIATPRAAEDGGVTFFRENILNQVRIYLGPTHLNLWQFLSRVAAGGILPAVSLVEILEWQNLTFQRFSSVSERGFEKKNTSKC